MNKTDCCESSPQDPENKGSEDLLEAGVFNPPLYKQRYSLVADILRKEAVKSVVDFGIAECKLMMYLKGIETMENIKGVDIDKDLLERSQFLINPLTTDYLLPRENPLLIQLWCGNIAQSDVRLSGVQAVTMVEIIEHLEPDTLAKFPENVFGFIAPKVVVITTPNSEYNVLFPNFTGFRHWDHKFEWTRKQFQDWSESVADRYGYSVTYTGVGKGGKGTEHLGLCSQVAIFIKKEDNGDEKDINCKICNIQQNITGEGKPYKESDQENCNRQEKLLTEDGVQPYKEEDSANCDAPKDTSRDTEPYHLVAESRHPCIGDRGISEEQGILYEAQYYMNMLINDHRQLLLTTESTEDNESAENDWLEIPLEKLLCFHKMKQKCDDAKRLGDILEQHGTRLSEDRLSAFVRWDFSSDEEEDFDADSQADSINNDHQTDHTTDHTTDHNFDNLQEDWDTDVETNEQKPGYYANLFSQNSPRKQEEELAVDSWEDNVSLDAFGVNRYDVLEYDQFRDADDESDIDIDRDKSEETLSHSSQTVKQSENENQEEGNVLNSESDNTITGSESIQNPPYLKRYRSKFVYTGEKLYSNDSQITPNKDNDSSSGANNCPYQVNSCHTYSQEANLISDNLQIESSQESCLTSGHNPTCDPSLTLDCVVTCQGCGCAMRQLHRGEFLCGMSSGCTNTAGITGNSDELSDTFAKDFESGLIMTDPELIEGQFSDAEEVKE